jgi:hypothetical protein
MCAKMEINVSENEREIESENEREYEIEAILLEIEEKNLFLVKWKGYSVISFVLIKTFRFQRQHGNR